MSRLSAVVNTTNRFRWVDCQVRLLQKLSKETDVRRAIANLPGTLEETYEQVLCTVEPENRHYILRALKWLLVDTKLGSFPLSALEEAVRLPDSDIAARDWHLPSALERLLGPLVTRASEAQIAIPHYSVAEYLFSDRIQHGNAQFFSTTWLEANAEVARTSLRQLLSLGPGGFPAVDIFMGLEPPEGFAFRALAGWREFVAHVDRAGGDAEVTDLVLKILDPSRPHYQGFLDIANTELLPFPEPTWPSRLYRWHIPPGAERVAVLLHTTSAELFLATKELLSRNPDLMATDRLKMGYEPFLLDDLSPFEMAIQRHSGPDFTRLFLDANRIDMRFRSSRGLCVLGCMMEMDPSDFQRYAVEFLLLKGASPNPPGVAYTPLQLAVVNRHSLWLVKILVAAGADINGFGNDETVAMCARSHSLKENRGKTNHYDTPLRIALDEECDQGVRDFLKDNGGKALHLFPIEGLPGYCKADVEAFGRSGEGC